MKLVKLLVIIALFGAVSCKKSKTAANPKMKNKIDSLSYAAGSLFGQWLQTAGHKELDYEIMNAVIQRALNGDSLTMDIEQSKAILQSYAMEAMKKNELKKQLWTNANSQRLGLMNPSSTDIDDVLHQERYISGGWQTSWNPSLEE